MDTANSGWRVPLPLGVLFCFGNKKFFPSAHLSGPSFPNQAIGNQFSPCAAMSLRPVSCYFFTRASGLTMQWLFPHNWKKFQIMCGDVSHDKVLDYFQFQPLLRTVSQAPAPSPSWPSPCELSPPYWGDFSKKICCFQASLSPDRWMGPKLSVLFWGAMLKSAAIAQTCTNFIGGYSAISISGTPCLTGKGWVNTHIFWVFL